MLFREDFNNGLAAPWTTVPTDTNYYNFQTGLMNLRANYGDTWTSYNRAINLFAVNTPTAGDFMMTLGITRFVPSLRQYPGIFLVAWDDTDNNVRYDYAGDYSGRGTSMSIESHQFMTSSAGISIDYGNNPFLMRLVKQGNMYSVWSSTNGVNYTAITNIPAAVYANFVPRQLGFWMGLDPNQTDTMLIDYFEIAALTMTNAGVPPVFASARLTGGLQGAPFLWEVSADYATGFSAAGLPPGLSLAQNGLITGTPIAAGVYDSTITATNIFGSANQTLRIVVRSTAGVIFRDDFNGGYSTNWTATPTNYATALPGIERCRANSGDTWGGSSPVPFALPAPTNGTFTITLGLNKFVPGNWGYPSVFLMAWQDFDHLVRFGNYGGPSGTRAEFSIESSAGVYAQNDYPTNFGSGPFLLRMNVTNNVYTSAFSTNAVDFIPLPGCFTNTFCTNTSVGFWVGADPYQNEIALVDYFEVSTTPPANPIAAWLAGFGLTGTNANYNADPDGDDSRNIFEYAFNTNPTNAASRFVPTAAVINDHLVLTFRERTGGAGTVGVDYTAGGVTYRVEVADSLNGTWASNTSLVEQLGSAVNNADGTETVKVQLKQLIPTATQKFMRLVLVPNP